MAPTAQKPLVGHFDSPAINPPHNLSRPLHHSHFHYESPFEQFDMRPDVLQSTADFFSQQLADFSAHLNRQPLVPTIFLIACAAALLALAVFLLGAKKGLEKQQRMHKCRRQFDVDQGFLVCEKVIGPTRSQSSWPETQLEFGLKAGSHARAAS